MNLIKYNDYETFCDYSFSKEKGIPPNGIIYVPMDEICTFFNLVKNSTNEYVIVSAASDFGFCEQDKNPISLDMKKWLSFINIGPEQGFNDLLIPARCSKENCKISDKYSVKVYSYTKETIDFFPACISRWYSTNNSIIDDRITQIPFGLPEWTYDFLEKTPLEDKSDLIYLNFQINTNERLSLYRSGNNCVLGRRGGKEISKEEYINDLKQYKYILCPPGNGIDTFRVSEVLACGSIPIVFNVPENDVYGNSVIRITNGIEITIANLENRAKYINLDSFNLSKDYWKQKIICD